jgi:branched-chain amino acid transport system substrate-binding protein
MTASNHIHRVLALVGACAVVVAGCGGDDGAASTDTGTPPSTTIVSTSTPGSSTTGGPSTSTATEAPSTAPTDTPAVAAGEPLVIGMYVPADVANYSTPEMIPAAEAAVEYINNELGGIAGRPIELHTCSTSGTPDSVAACANELLQTAPVLIVGGPDAAASTAAGIFKEAGIPVVGGGALNPTELTSDIRFVFQGFAAATVPAMTHFAATELGAQRLALLAPESPGTPQVVDLFMKPLATSLGLPTPELVQVPLTSPDPSTQLFAALDGNPDAVLILGLPCQPILSAYKSLGAEVPIILPESCAEPDVLADNADTAEGAYFVGLAHRPDVDPDNPDVVTFTDKVELYGDDVPVTDSSLETFSSFMNIHTALDSLAPDSLSPQVVIDTLRSQGPQHNFLKDTYDCGAPPTPLLPGVCDASGRLLHYADGTLSAVTGFVGPDTLWPST